MLVHHAYKTAESADELPDAGEEENHSECKSQKRISHFTMFRHLISPDLTQCRQDNLISQQAFANTLFRRIIVAPVQDAASARKNLSSLASAFQADSAEKCSMPVIRSPALI